MGEYRVIKDTFKLTPIKQSFTTDEDVIVNVKATLERRNGLGAHWVWSSDYTLVAGGQTFNESRDHFMAPHTEVDHVDDNFEMNLGKFSEGQLTIAGTVSAHG